MARVFLSIGSNIDKENNVRRFLRLLRSDRRVTLLAVSPVYENAAVGPTGQPPFLNLAVEVDTELAPEAMFRKTRRWERELGRKRSADKYAPRTLDVDLILYDNVVGRFSEFTLPHPQLAKEGFVLLPMAALAPELKHPVTNQTMSEALSASKIDVSSFKEIRLF